MVDCSIFASNPGCDGIVCYTDWTKADTAPMQKNTFCKPFTGTYAVCGTTCGVTQWGNECCSATDWVSCFTALAKKSCANGGSNGLGTVTHALGQTSAISTISGHALVVSSTATSVAAHVTGSSTTTASGSSATAHSSAERSMGFGSRFVVYGFLATILAHIVV